MDELSHPLCVMRFLQAHQAKMAIITVLDYATRALFYYSRYIMKTHSIPPLIYVPIYPLWSIGHNIIRQWSIIRLRTGILPLVFPGQLSPSAQPGATLLIQRVS